MRKDLNSTFDNDTDYYESEFGENVKKYVKIAAISAIFATPLKIQADTYYTTNQIELKINEIEKCFDIETYLDIDENSFENENLNIITSKIDKEFNKYSKYIVNDVSDAKTEAKRIAKGISSIKFNQVAVELTPSNTIKFTLTFDDKKMLMLTYPFDKIEGVPEGEVLFSFFVNRNLLVSDSLNLKDLVIGINNYLSV